MSEVIFVEGLTKSYGEKTVVNQLNLSVKSGTVFGLLGANGAGKSTTIECMLGTKQADSITPWHLRNKTAICDTIATNLSNLQNQRRQKNVGRKNLS